MRAVLPSKLNARIWPKAWKPASFPPSCSSSLRPIGRRSSTRSVTDVAAGAPGAPGADECGARIARQRNADAGGCEGLGGELPALLHPRSARAYEDEGGAAVDAEPTQTDRGGAAVVRECDGLAEAPPAELRAGCQLRTCPGPGRTRTREDRSRADRAVVPRAADESGARIHRQRNARAEHARSGLVEAGELASRLRPHRPLAREHQGRAPTVVVAGGTDHTAVSPPPDSATALPKPEPVAPVPVSFGPCCAHVVPDRTKTQAAPRPASSEVPPTRAVLPSPERATLTPANGPAASTGTSSRPASSGSCPRIAFSGSRRDTRSKAPVASPALPWLSASSTSFRSADPSAAAAEAWLFPKVDPAGATVDPRTVAPEAVPGGR